MNDRDDSELPVHIITKLKVTIYYNLLASKNSNGATKNPVLVSIIASIQMVANVMQIMKHYLQETLTIGIIEMKTFIAKSLKMMMAITATLLFSASCLAQNVLKPAPDNNLTYTVKPDLRKCAFPACGGWYLTPVNQYSLQLENTDEAYQHSLLLHNSIYVASINYKPLGLTPDQIQKLENIMRSGQALLRGSIGNPLNSTSPIAGRVFTAQNAWTSPNKNDAVGPYLKVSSSGIVCITTPCPYFKAELINSLFTTNFDELVFDKAGLDREQEAVAWKTVASDGLVITGVKYESQGQTGPGTGISATKVFFVFPGK